MLGLLNMMRREAQRVASQTAQKRFAVVTGYDPDHYAVKVNIQPEDRPTGWLPLSCAWVGNGWGLYAPPSIGDVVEVDFQEGDRESGIVGDRFYSASVKPLSVPSGEYWLVHSSGSYIKFKNDGSVTLKAATNLRLEAQNIKIHASGTYAFDANGQGQKWDGSGVETWQDNDTVKPHHNHAPPETP